MWILKIIRDSMIAFILLCIANYIKADVFGYFICGVITGTAAMCLDK